MASVDSGNGNCPRVLFVDDEARVVRSLRALFRDMAVWTTTEPTEAPAIAESNDIDVIVCDQRMPRMRGVEVLREVKRRAPRAMRVLLTGYSDFELVVGSVNEGEVFRFINKPWDNEHLRETVSLAADIARRAPPAMEPEAVEEASEEPPEEVAEAAQVLVLSQNARTHDRLRDILGERYQLRIAGDGKRALQLMERQETAAVIADAVAVDDEITQLLKALKQYHPHIPTLVITERSKAQTIINLINEGQVYRLLLKPIRPNMCRLNVASAFERYARLKQNPEAASRYHVDAQPEGLSESLLERVKRLPARLIGSRATAHFF